ncbi:YggT family protein [Collinsella ihumii]|uniref:YggT family protein n=1 Tax=Collinsella ihumii TaxID=1720204 RepID=UPI0025AAB820|nr:YggT family protein [Collinsella ihumii]MDN0055416.1 YggT family protein [Collinsella ihumii]
MLSTLVNFYEILIVVYCLFSFFPIRQGGFMYDVAMVLNSLVGPYLNLFRRIIPPMGGLDFSPVIALLALNLGFRLLVSILL